MMKRVTVSAEEQVIEAARARARAGQTTLSEQFRRWLADYARLGQSAVIDDLRGKLKVGRKLSRDEMNERR